MIEITKNELEKLYRENTNDKVCETLGMSKATLIKYLNEAGIELKGKGNPTQGINSKRLRII